jgi:hypothetical protein
MVTMSINYRFLLKDGRTLSYTVALDNATGVVVEGPREEAPPSWTELEYKKCVHCPLKPDTHSACPPALGLARIADDFKSEKSYDQITVEVVTAERTYSKELPLQAGLFGLFGLIMASSACPYFNFLKPMARFHLPFSTVQETMVRSVSLYLLRQYFVQKNGGKPDYELVEFKTLYADLEKVNQGMVNRIRAITKADADANSIVILDGFAKLLAMHITDGFTNLEKMFAG